MVSREENVKTELVWETGGVVQVSFIYIYFYTTHKLAA